MSFTCASQPPAAGFTLIELLTVIAIIGTLASLLLPSLSQAKIRTRDTQCLNNFKQIGVAYKLYADDHGRFPPASVVEIDPTTQQLKRKTVVAGMGGVDPAPFPYNDQFAQATNRPLYRYQGNPHIFRCPMDKGHLADLDYPRDPNFYTKPTAWETAGCSYRYNAGLGAPIDPNRFPPLAVTLRPSQGNIARKPEAWVASPSRFILMNEPPAQPLIKVISPTTVIPYWTQWHRNRGRIDFRDPTIAPRMFVSPVLFVDGHAAIHDFSASVMTDPYFPYEETKDWQWYQPRD